MNEREESDVVEESDLLDLLGGHLQVDVGDGEQGVGLVQHRIDRRDIQLQEADDVGVCRSGREVLLSAQREG